MEQVAELMFKVYQNHPFQQQFVLLSAAVPEVLPVFLEESLTVPAVLTFFSKAHVAFSDFPTLLSYLDAGHLPI